MSPSTRLARTLVTALLDAGVTEAVLAPGSRNAPLSFALHDAASAGLLRLHTRIDERTAGFLALGMAKVSGRPVPVVCTSGTAVANLQPAVLEAHHAAVPLVALTADRPLRLRGTSANQTTDQVGLLRGARSLDLAALQGHGAGDDGAGVDGVGVDGVGHADAVLEMLLADRSGPLHLNVQLDDPLVPQDRWQPPSRLPSRTEEAAPGWRRERHAGVVIPRGPRTVVVAGDDAGPDARILAEEGGWPLLAEPTSGARTGAHALRCYRLLLDGDLGAEVERVLVLGHPTLSRPVTRLLSRPDVEVWDVGPGLWRPRPFRVHHEAPHASVAAADSTDQRSSVPDAQWLQRWREADASLSRQLDALLAAEADLTPYEVAGAVSRAVPPDGLLVVGASSPIRDLDLMVQRYGVGERRKVVANRGLAGIDGTLSTAIGAALARPHSERALVLLGDVTFLHDATGLVMGPQEARPDLTVVVVNDDGGSIFTMLEQGAEPYATSYEKLFGTPHGVDLAALCAATRTPHWRVESLAELEHALAAPVGGIDVVEVRCRRDNRRELDGRIRALRP